MRPLEESEIQQVFEKLFKFVGKNLKNIVDRADQPHCFRLHKKVRQAHARPTPSTRSRYEYLVSREASERGGVEENPHPIADAETGERTFFFRARAKRGFFPARAFFATPARRPTRARASQTAVMRKYPRFRTASVDEAHTILWLNFFG